MYLANTAEAGKIYISVIKAENVTGDGVLFNIEFTAAASASGKPRFPSPLTSLQTNPPTSTPDTPLPRAPLL